MCARVLHTCVQGSWEHVCSTSVHMCGETCADVYQNVQRTLSKSFFALYSIRLSYCIQFVSRAIFNSYTVLYSIRISLEKYFAYSTL